MCPGQSWYSCLDHFGGTPLYFSHAQILRRDGRALLRKTSSVLHIWRGLKKHNQTGKAFRNPEPKLTDRYFLHSFSQIKVVLWVISRKRGIICILQEVPLNSAVGWRIVASWSSAKHTSSHRILTDMWQTWGPLKSCFSLQTILSGNMLSILPCLPVGHIHSRWHGPSLSHHQLPVMKHAFLWKPLLCPP